MVAGFIYNSICDTTKDPKGKNAITRGDFAKNTAFIVVIASIIISLLIFLLTYRSKLSLIFFIFYIFLWLAYSGLKLRFKESLMAPLIASIVLWVGAPFILLTEFNYYDFTTTFLWLGLFVIYIGHEIKHTTIEHDMDLEYNCKTFAVRCGKKASTIIEYITLIVGYIFLLISINYFPGISFIEFTILFALLFSTSVISTVSYGYKVNYNLSRDRIFITMPYLTTKIFIIVYSLIVLQLSIFLVLFVIWIFLINRYP
jgi:4-hydroxybenzoate polyprenyltransferase